MAQSPRDTVIHLIAGGMAGTVGAIVTCPLEVVKTRLQSSSAGFQVHNMQVPKIASPEGNNHVTCKTIMSSQRRGINTVTSRHATQFLAISHYENGMPPNKSMGLIQYMRHIVKYEGTKALFKGLGPNLVGVAPSRAIYFCAYSQTKSFLNSVLNPDTAIVHIFSASCAGFVACSATNPIWFVKTRLQLDFAKSGEQLTVGQCIRRIYRKMGILGFYKGITASYYGISETVIHFVIYEALKAQLVARRSRSDLNGNEKTSKDFLEFMMAGAISKTVASCISYPHGGPERREPSKKDRPCNNAKMTLDQHEDETEDFDVQMELGLSLPTFVEALDGEKEDTVTCYEEVARTRLREEGNKYTGFWQTLRLVYREEGHRGLYRGLATQLIRQIPNTAIMMATYEAVVYLLTSYCDSNFYVEEELEE